MFSAARAITLQSYYENSRIVSIKTAIEFELANAREVSANLIKVINLFTCLKTVNKLILKI
jgi:hypothetical protein